MKSGAFIQARRAGLGYRLFHRKSRCGPFVPSIAEQSRSDEHTSELQSLMRTSYAVFCLKKIYNTPAKLPHITIGSPQSHSLIARATYSQRLFGLYCGYVSMIAC